MIDTFVIELFSTGCPFRHTDADLLRQRLAAYRVPKKGIDEVNIHQAFFIVVTFPQLCYNLFPVVQPQPRKEPAYERFKTINYKYFVKVATYL